MSGELEKLLGYNNSGNLHDEEVEQIVPKHPLDGKLLTRLEVTYLTKLLDCSDFEAVVCAQKSIQTSKRLSKLFLLEDNDNSGSLHTINMTVVLGDKNDERKRQNHLISFMNDTLVHFELTSITDTGEREIVEIVTRGDGKPKERKYSEDKTVFEDFNVVMEVVQNIDTRDWSESNLCKNCPVKKREVK